MCEIIKAVIKTQKIGLIETMERRSINWHLGKWEPF